MTENKKRSLSVPVLILIVLTIAVITLFFISKVKGAGDSNTGSENDSSVSSSESEEKKHNPQYEKYGDISDMTIILKFGDQKETLDINTFSEWITVSKTKEGRFTYKTKDDEIKNYSEQLAKKYSTFQDTLKFNTHSGEEINIQNKSVGWILDENYTEKALKKTILNRMSITFDLTNGSEESNKWWLRIAGKYGKYEGYGNTYAEVSISDQYMWLYKNGKIIMESNVVTGGPSTGNDTPKGAFRVYNKKEGATLYGPGYWTTVSYWVGIYEDIGFHDATWRDKFGGNIYLEDGSHGCVNLPIESAEKIYDEAYVDMPVFIY